MAQAGDELHEAEGERGTKFEFRSRDGRILKGSKGEVFRWSLQGEFYDLRR